MMSSSTSVLSIIKASGKGALPPFFLPLMLKLNEKWAENRVAIIDPQGSFSSDIPKGLEVASIKEESFWSVVKALRANIRSKCVDVVHVHGREYFYAGFWAAKFEKVKFVYSGYQKQDFDLPKFWLYQTHEIIAADQIVLDYALYRKKIKSERIHLVVTGIDLEYVDYRKSIVSRQDVRAQLQLPDERFFDWERWVIYSRRRSVNIA